MQGTREKVNLTVEILTSDPRMLEFARRYWDARWDDGANIVYGETVTSLCEEFGVRKSQVRVVMDDLAHVTYGERTSVR